jgi:hypothetical protein
MVFLKFISFEFFYWKSVGISKEHIFPIGCHIFNHTLQNFVLFEALLTQKSNLAKSHSANLLQRLNLL